MGGRLSLLDVLPRHERVDIGGQEIEVYGISTEDVGAILARYPDGFQEMLASASGKAGIAGMDPGLLGAMIAASQRNGEGSLLGDEAVELRARSYSIGVQMKMVLAIGRSTFPDGVGPFLQGLASLYSGASEVTRVLVQVASKEQAMTGPARPKPSAAPDTPPSGS